MTRCYVSRVAIPQYSETADLMLANRYAVSLMVHEIETRTAVTPSWAVPLNSIRRILRPGNGRAFPVVRRY